MKNLHTFEEFLNESRSNEKVLSEIDKYFNEDVDENFDIVSYELGKMSQRAIEQGDTGSVSLGVGLAIIAGSIMIPAASVAVISYWDEIKNWFKKKKIQRFEKKLDSIMGIEQLDDIIDVLKVQYPETYRLITSNKAKAGIIKGLNNIKSKEEGKDLLKNIDVKFMEELVRRLKIRSRKK